MPLPTLLLWSRYWQAEPWGEERADLRQGITSSIVANALAPKGKSFSPADFVLTPKPTPKPTDWRVWKATTDAIAAAVKAHG